TGLKPGVMSRYVALGSSMAAGPGIRPRAAGAPRRAGRSARNYPHLVAEQLSLDLTDVGYIPLLMAASLPEAMRRLPLLGDRICELLDPDARDNALATVFDSLCAV